MCTYLLFTSVILKKNPLSNYLHFSSFFFLAHFNLSCLSLCRPYQNWPLSVASRTPIWYHALLLSPSAIAQLTASSRTPPHPATSLMPEDCFKVLFSLLFLLLHPLVLFWFFSACPDCVEIGSIPKLSSTHALCKWVSLFHRSAGCQN